MTEPTCRRPGWIVVWMLATAACVPAAGGEGAKTPYRIAVLSDRIASPDQGLAAHLAGVLRGEGFTVQALTCEELASAAGLSARRFDCLLLADSPRFPGVAKENLLAFLRAGGDLVLLGGHAFSDPVCRVGDEWLTQAQLRERMQSLPAGATLLSFDEGDLSDWKRSTNKPEHPSRAVLDAGRSGRCLLLDLKDLGPWQWDTHSTPVAGRIPEGHNALSFWAKGAERTPQVAVEVSEKDGARWVAVVDLSPAWRRFVLTPLDFRYLADGAPKSRGGKEDHLRLDEGARLSFGLATGLTAHPDGDHRVYVDEVSTTKADLPAHLDFSTRVELNAFDDYEAYRMRGAKRVVGLWGSEVVASGLPAAASKPEGTPFPRFLISSVSSVSPIERDFEGLSAVGFGLLSKSTFVPLLEARGGQGRSLGWAAGLLVNYAGPYKDSHWLLSGITSPGFYRDARFGPMLAGLLRQVAGRDLAAEAAKAETESRAAKLPLTAPAPKGFVRLSPDRKRFLGPDGKPLFLTGVNYLGHWNHFCQMAGGGFDVHLLEEDFRKAREAGVNAMRVWCFADVEPNRRDALRECARRYGVYLLFEVARFERDGDAALEKLRELAAQWKDEPMVLGYDLANEPYVSTVSPMRFGREKSPLLRLDPYTRFAGKYDRKWVDKAVETRPQWPRVGDWVAKEDLPHLYALDNLYSRYVGRFIEGGASYSTLTGVSGRLPLDEPEWRDYAVALNDTFGEWIRRAAGALREGDPNHLVTVGYNTVLSCLPCNEQLDFVSQHVYQRPTSYEEVVKNVTTMDRLAKVWPSQPITLGEFGYSNGLRIGPEYLDFHTSAVGEMMHYLAALAKGHSGCFKWMLGDLPAAIAADNARWIATDNHYEHWFGMYAYDGTPHGRPKPICRSLRFLREYVDDGGGGGGEIEIRRAETPIGAGYTYRAKAALFVGDRSAKVPGLEFRADAPANVMLRWDAKGIALMSDADAEVRIEPSVFVPAAAKVSGKHGGCRAEGKALVIRALEGEGLVIR